MSRLLFPSQPLERAWTTSGCCTQACSLFPSPKVQFRPFPTTELRECLGKFKGVGIIDRDCAHGSPDCGGILFHDMRSCMYPLTKRPVMTNFIGGLGGRDISIDDCIKMFDLTKHAADKGMEDVGVTWIGLRE